MALAQTIFEVGRGDSDILSEFCEIKLYSRVLC